MGLFKKIIKKILFWQKEEKVLERKAKSSKPVQETKTEPRKGQSNPSINSIIRETRISTIRAQNIARNHPTKPLRGMPKSQNHYQARLWHNKGEIDPKENM